MASLVSLLNPVVDGDHVDGLGSGSEAFATSLHGTRKPSRVRDGSQSDASDEPDPEPTPPDSGRSKHVRDVDYNAHSRPSSPSIHSSPDYDDTGASHPAHQPSNTPPSSFPSSSSPSSASKPRELSQRAQPSLSPHNRNEFEEAGFVHDQYPIRDSPNNPFLGNPDPHPRRRAAPLDHKGRDVCHQTVAQTHKQGCISYVFRGHRVVHLDECSDSDEDTDEEEAGPSDQRLRTFNRFRPKLLFPEAHQKQTLQQQLDQRRRAREARQRHPNDLSQTSGQGSSSASATAGKVAPTNIFAEELKRRELRNQRRQEEEEASHQRSTWSTKRPLQASSTQPTAEQQQRSQGAPRPQGEPASLQAGQGLGRHARLLDSMARAGWASSSEEEDDEGQDRGRGRAASWDLDDEPATARQQPRATVSTRDGHWTDDDDDDDLVDAAAAEASEGEEEDSFWRGSVTIGDDRTVRGHAMPFGGQAFVNRADRARMADADDEGDATLLPGFRGGGDGAMLAQEGRSKRRISEVERGAIEDGRSPHDSEYDEGASDDEVQDRRQKRARIGEGGQGSHCVPSATSRALESTGGAGWALAGAMRYHPQRVALAHSRSYSGQVHSAQQRTGMMRSGSDNIGLGARAGVSAVAAGSGNRSDAGSRRVNPFDIESWLVPQKKSSTPVKIIGGKETRSERREGAEERVL